LSPITLSTPKQNADGTRFAYLKLKGGVEAVRNADKPSSIAALHAYNGGVRPLLGANLTLILDSITYGDDIKPRLSLTGDYVARILLSPEPLTHMVDSKPLVSLSRGTRQITEVTLLWQATPYWGLFSKYKYGSVRPPLRLHGSPSDRRRGIPGQVEVAQAGALEDGIVKNVICLA
jgi:hypothetical protein